TIPRFGKFELTLDLHASYTNAFDPAEIDVFALFQSPSGRSVRVNGYLDQPFARRLEANSEKLNAVGEPLWKLRFTPNAEGAWRYRVFAKDRSGTAELPEAALEVTVSTAPGFLGRSIQNPRGFAWDSGRAFFPVGENMCWGGSRGSF